ncbi:3-phosphoshikimate 1-carboxyvinyltransferase [Actinomyces slackii]|uniref:3-phosphoshikimate 1-carboxyvinyltransferase n=2 Tax=Actinomyces slackii TaxID=52774 RepID=A0A448KFW7_9ACTO|nr:3-phosphoshikimate 1-carboxyvinyltransferase [Actinomyces slackii]VEG75790.1 3-phosphoshikimate 1-carboxyvinyltransferase [Actinomyces slackii]
MHHASLDAPPWPAPSAPGPLNAVVELPGSKSLSARALVLAAIAAEPSTITGVLRARDTELMIAALTTLGARFEEAGSPTRLRVTPAPLPFPVSRAPAQPGQAARIDCGLAGTVMRFIPPLAALADAPVLLDGDEAARARPLGPLLEAITALGATVDYQGRPGHLPALITPSPAEQARPGEAHPPLLLPVDSSASSQFLSALLLAAPLLPGGAAITPTGPVPSLPHVAMTVASLRDRGVVVDEPADPLPDLPDGSRTWTVHPGRPHGGEIAIEPDLSNAGPFLAAALVAGGQVTVPHWPAPTTQAGDAWRCILPAMGGALEAPPGPQGAGTAVRATGTGRLRGIDVDLSQVGELAPTVAALAALAAHQGHPSRLRGIAHLRGHETDRLAALAAEITRLGGSARAEPDALVIEPATLHGALLRSYADHRMATFAAIIGLAIEGVELDDVECTSKTLPGFTGLWDSMLATARGQ